MMMSIILIVVEIIWFVINKLNNDCTSKLYPKDNFILFFHHTISTFIQYYCVKKL